MRRLILVLAIVGATIAAPAAGAAPATLSLQMGTGPVFGAFTPGTTRDYLASTTASVNSTAASATLSVHDGSGASVGYLVNDGVALPQALEASAGGTGASSTGPGPVPGPDAARALLTYGAPASNAALTILVKQPIGAGDALQPGTYGKVLTVTLSTTTPCTMSTTATFFVAGVVAPNVFNPPPSTTPSGTVSCPELVLSDFLAPVDTEEANIAKAGRIVPLKWRVTDADGEPVADVAHFESVTSVGDTCGSAPADAIEDYVSKSGLQYLGDGYWQFNWKTPSDYAGQCRTLVLTLSDGTTRTAGFKFR